ncbi:hypothetical protein E2562_023441 [Oryza meyeriana var. granulata]|uniref:Uncharacterized protein n=1 Tax=Oryza meyeriana var. granulata TaxID=110450 RepID=A0A6G1FBG4_9ORYZ|nr:hypothetical protein E2562_023441 [Oryza meyeriana var. granulata]
MYSTIQVRPFAHRRRVYQSVPPLDVRGICYGIAIMMGLHNVVAVRRTIAHLGMMEATDHSNLATKLNAFLSSYLLCRRKDALAVLHSTRH